MVLGVTGGIASGKSTVAALFAERGATLVSADQLAREIVAPGSPVLQQLVESFGPEVLCPDGTLNRDWLRQRIFALPQERERLNAITHPAIAALAETRLADLRRLKIPLVVYEAPLLFEAGAEGRVDQVLVVTIDPAVQVERLCRRDGIDADEARTRIAAQWPQAEKVARADFVIDNSFDLEHSRAQVEHLHLYLTRHMPHVSQAPEES